MSVTTVPTVGPARRATRPPARPSLTATSRVLVLGNLVWLGWLWASLLVLLPIALLVAAATDRDLTQSLWSGAGIAWQRWILFSGGIVIARVFLREFVTRGITRRQLAHSAVVAIATLAAIGAVVGIAGYLIEWAIFHWQGWPLELASGETFNAGRIPRLAVEYGMLGAAYSGCGWLVGSAFVRFRWVGATLLIPVCFVPVAIVEFVVSRSTRGLQVLPGSPDHPSVWLTLGVALPVVAATGVVAARVTRSLPLR